MLKRPRGSEDFFVSVAHLLSYKWTSRFSLFSGMGLAAVKGGSITSIANDKFLQLAGQVSRDGFPGCRPCLGDNVRCRQANRHGIFMDFVYHRTVGSPGRLAWGRTIRPAAGSDFV